MTHTTVRNRHLRGDTHHVGNMTSLLVELSSEMSGLSAGATLEAALAALDARVNHVENASIFVFTFKLNCVIARGHWTIDARVMPMFTVDAFFLSPTVSDTFGADAIVKSTMSGSFMSDAIAMRALAESLTADAVNMAAVPGYFTVDATTLSEGTVVDSFAVDAGILKTQGSAATSGAIVLKAMADSAIASAISKATVSDSVDADAVLLAVLDGYLTLDAWISSGTTVPGSLTADSIALKTNTPTPVTSDAVFLASIASSVDVDATLSKEMSGAFSADSWASPAPVVDDFSADAIVLRTYSSDADATPSLDSMSSPEQIRNTLLHTFYCDAGPAVKSALAFWVRDRATFPTFTTRAYGDVALSTSTTATASNNASLIAVATDVTSRADDYFDWQQSAHEWTDTVVGMTVASTTVPTSVDADSGSTSTWQTVNLSVNPGGYDCLAFIYMTTSSADSTLTVGNVNGQTPELELTFITGTQNGHSYRRAKVWTVPVAAGSGDVTVPCQFAYPVTVGTCHVILLGVPPADINADAIISE